eukprot:785918-Rhodomonas_salina.1
MSSSELAFRVSRTGAGDECRCLGFSDLSARTQLCTFLLRSDGAIPSQCQPQPCRQGCSGIRNHPRQGELRSALSRVVSCCNEIQLVKLASGPGLLPWSFSRFFTAD